MELTIGSWWNVSGGAFLNRHWQRVFARIRGVEGSVGSGVRQQGMFGVNGWC